VMDSLQSDLLNAVNGFLSERVGLYFSELRYADLERGLATTAAELNYEDAGGCVQDLLSNRFGRSQMQILVRNLTIGETYFFRDPAVFLSLEENILPEITARKRGRQYLRVWSAGCSTGEEPYSIAISIMRSLPDYKQWQLSLLATDINTRSLEKARQGKYGLWSFRTMPEDFLPVYFDDLGDSGTYLLKEAVRKMVVYGYLNLAEDDYPSLTGNTNDFDIVFCRNVLIYFTQQKAREIAARLSKSLVAGGVLVTGANDMARLFNSMPADMERLNSTTFRKKVPSGQ
jgi:chemotaxis protein methyltransferase CheR